MSENVKKHIKKTKEEYKNLYKFLKHKSLEQQKEEQKQAQLEQNIIQRLKQQYISSITDKERKLQEWYILQKQKILEQFKNESNKEKALAELYKIYENKVTEVIASEFDKRKQKAFAVMNNIVDKEKLTAEQELAIKVKLLNTITQKEIESINKRFAKDKEAREAHLKALKNVYYKELNDLLDKYTGKVKKATLEQYYYNNFYTNKMTQHFKDAWQFASKFYKNKTDYMTDKTSDFSNNVKDIVDNLKKNSITKFNTMSLSYADVVQNMLNNTKTKTEQMKWSFKYLADRFFDYADNIENKWNKTLQNLGITARNVATDMENNFENLFFNTFTGKIKTLGDFWHNFTTSLKNEFFKTVSKIAAKKIVMYFINSWDNSSNKNGQGFVEKLLGIDIPFLKFAEGTIWGSGTYGIVPGSASYAGDDYRNDTVPALISPGEAVLPRSVVSKHYNLIKALLIQDNELLRAYDGVLYDNNTMRVKKFGFGHFIRHIAHTAYHTITHPDKAAKNLISSATSAINDTISGATHLIQDVANTIGDIGTDLFTDPKSMFADLGKDLKHTLLDAFHNSLNIIYDTTLKPLGISKEDFVKGIIDALGFINKYGWYIQLALAIANPALIPAMLSADAMTVGMALAQGQGLKEGLNEAGGSGALAGIGSELAYFYNTGELTSNITITDSLKNTMNDIKTWGAEKLEKLKEAINSMNEQQLEQLVGNKISNIKEKLLGVLQTLENFASNPDTLLQKGAELLQHGYSSVEDLLAKTYNYIVTHIVDIVKHIRPNINGANFFAGWEIANAIGTKTPLNLQNSVKALATGGIVTQPTLALVAEGGESEAVIPLSKMSEVTGQDKVLEELNKISNLLENLLYYNRQMYKLEVEGE